MTSVIISLMKSGFLPLLLSVSSSSSGAGRGITERVDLIELNHFYDDQGKHAYDQVIFYEWSPDYRRFHVIAWSLIEDDMSRVPFQQPGSREYAVNWFDRDSKVEREVRSKLFRETWSQVDPERANKRLIEEKHRISLLRVADCNVCQR